VLGRFQKDKEQFVAADVKERARQTDDLPPTAEELSLGLYLVLIRPTFLYQSKLEFLSVTSPIAQISCGFRPIDVLLFSVARLCSSANAAGVRSARALCGRS